MRKIRYLAITFVVLSFLTLILVYFIYDLNGWLRDRPNFLPKSATSVRTFVGGSFGFTMDGFQATKARITLDEFYQIVANFNLVERDIDFAGSSGFEGLINRWWWDPFDVPIDAPFDPNVKVFVSPPESDSNEKIFAQYHNGHMYFITSWGF